MTDILVIFVHGYSVSSFDTYGELPRRLSNEARSRGFTLLTEHVFLTRYVSLNDVVRLDDLSSAFETAIQTEICNKYPDRNFSVITHSTGGPLLRLWMEKFYKKKNNCRLRHLIMLAPPNHGSALAQLGKSKLGRVRAWFGGTESGQKVLDWLEHGSPQAWELNTAQASAGDLLKNQGIFYFVLTGQSIDRKLYDHINSYTGEPGSDGVVRVASANLNTSFIVVKQQKAARSAFSRLIVKEKNIAGTIPFRILFNKSHSNDDIGIMRSVKAPVGDTAGAETISAIFDCLAVSSADAFEKIVLKFERESQAVQQRSRLETERRPIGKKYYIHDRYAIVIFRVRDNEGMPVTDYDLLLTAGPENDADDLPPGFFADRQSNKNDRSALTYYFNYDVMHGCEAVLDEDGKEVRPAQPGIRSFGFTITARPDSGLVRYKPAVLKASEENFTTFLRPNATTLVEIVLKRELHTELLRIMPLDTASGDWKDAGE